jgi:hypothetical protein
MGVDQQLQAVGVDEGDRIEVKDHLGRGAVHGARQGGRQSWHGRAVDRAHGDHTHRAACRHDRDGQIVGGDGVR